MATNFEFYKDEIFEYAAKELCVNKDGYIAECGLTPCADCIFFIKNRGCPDKQVMRRFLQEEHIESPKLTKRERAFCEAVQTGWISGMYEGVAFSTNKPTIRKTEKREHLIFGSGDAFAIPCNLFEWVKKHEIFSIEDLLKLEVEECNTSET